MRGASFLGLVSAGGLWLGLGSCVLGACAVGTAADILPTSDTNATFPDSSTGATPLGSRSADGDASTDPDAGVTDADVPDAAAPPAPAADAAMPASGCAGFAAPTEAAGCTCPAGKSCTANHCYNGYYCSLNVTPPKCVVKPASCP